METLPNVVARMNAQADQWERTGDSRTVFLRCYALMTGNMLSGVEKGRFQDTAWVDRLLHLFAEYYFIALAQYERSDPGTPPVWHHAHFTTCSRQLHVLQNLLLGINAHINYDLVLALRDLLAPEWAGLSEGQKQSRYQDHLLVNTLIAETIDTVQDEVVEIADPRMDIIDRLMGRLDERLLSALITRWREAVWKDAQCLIATATSEEAEMACMQVEKRALQRAHMITLI